MALIPIARLPSDVLLVIFLYLNSYQLVICRRVSRQFKDVIDNNQLLWRIFEWNQQDQESFVPALDMFDEHSHSSLEQVSIQEQRTAKEEDRLHLMQVLHRSKETLREVDLKVSHLSTRIEKGALGLVAAGSNLTRMVVWFWGSTDLYPDSLPLSRLVFSSLRAQSSTVDQLQVLWAYRGIGAMDSKHLKHFKSLISFAQYGRAGPLEFRELISNFSETIVHLKIRVDRETSMSKPLSCPNLKVFEGLVINGLSSFFEAPRLQTVVLEEVRNYELEGIPSSVEEIWLRIHPYLSFLDAEAWEQLLLHSCPKLKILKLIKHSFTDGTDQHVRSVKTLLEPLDSRNRRARDGNEIDGIKIVSLQKLVLRTDLLSIEQLDRAAKVVAKVIDVKDYPDIIEIEC